ncbi:MAG: phosphatase PAP2 family protein [Candidatus Moranbacteria bacterium]|nr:phosphatase PAP2 family protein [Candidatus Moranbacteria bacterium]
MDSFIIFGAQYLYLVIVIAALVYICWQPKELCWKIALCAIIALPLTYIAAKIVSNFYFDPRPFVIGQFTPLLPHAADNGFPSDHTLLGSAVAAVIFFFHRKLGFLLFVVAFLVGVSRVFAGIHHFADIFGSMVIAAVVTSIVSQYIFPLAWKQFSQKCGKTL